MALVKDMAKWVADNLLWDLLSALIKGQFHSLSWAHWLAIFIVLLSVGWVASKSLGNLNPSVYVEIKEAHFQDYLSPGGLFSHSFINLRVRLTNNRKERLSVVDFKLRIKANGTMSVAERERISGAYVVDRAPIGDVPAFTALSRAPEQLDDFPDVAEVEPHGAREQWLRFGFPSHVLNPGEEAKETTHYILSWRHARSGKGKIELAGTKMPWCQNGILRPS